MILKFQQSTKTCIRNLKYVIGLLFSRSIPTDIILFREVDTKIRTGKAFI